MSEGSKKVNVIRHLAFEDLASFTSVLQAHGYQINYFEAADYALRPEDLLKRGSLTKDLLIILGGPISVNDAAMFPFIEAEIELLQQRIAADRATLGICLGAQLIASALEARVYSGQMKEIGWYKLALTEAGEHSALRYLGAEHCSMLHWHGETFDLPAGATLLASSENYTNQAFSYGQNILALQFHPEITYHGMEKWYIGHIGEILQTEGVSVEKLREQTRQFANQLEVQGELFFNSWLNQVTRN
jgi:GMP synthase (glutamine-hydrolysing)